ncbi:ATV_HP_G0066760.mRNA.1.CDS.1 [Saccharomyces cerevisiae]|uniref:Homeobox protein tos8 n=1 Tax=Saccharomyces pastorianus TaxID=27292 RepID=A0A6C1DQZ7_SACPS|nr:Homeobox protein tos8 [Saccharomyces pastorianus]CAI5055504.1 ATV_HP_G0024540.mRNA.1.CDS.1 [Saccharomyces cerevisiae]CAI5184684.1 ATV_HP_G0066760.mRNA.1.CDS.1 [Saccharomyces cerevisiae]CAI6960168.1 ATV_HP_G0024540.mRNA.1.CDS.1 [Saccharomyces cerevisiae]CAI7002089.1 ATV_HP_G0066760.mRNA.1.CDS.1 [Saccharomyces cerevisiae]
MGTSIVNLNQKIELPPIQVLFESLNRENETKPHFEERRLYQPNPSFVPRTNIAVGSPVNPVPVSSPVFFIGPSPQRGIQNHNAIMTQNIRQYPVIYNNNREVISTGERNYIITVGGPPVTSSQPEYEHISTPNFYQEQRLAQPHPVNESMMVGGYTNPQPISISRGKMLSGNISTNSVRGSSNGYSAKEKKHKAHGKRSNLPKATVSILNKWLHEHVNNPYPTVQEKRELLAKTGLTKLQISN